MQAMPDQQIRLIKYAINGTALYNDWKPEEGPQYHGLMQAAQSALANLEAQQIPMKLLACCGYKGKAMRMRKWELHTRQIWLPLSKRCDPSSRLPRCPLSLREYATFTAKANKLTWFETLNKDSQKNARGRLF
jgi:hypothetical protein